MKNKKLKLALHELEQEMEVIHNEELTRYKGGSGNTDGEHFTLEEYVRMLMSGTWMGGYVEGMDGYVPMKLKEVVAEGKNSTGNYNNVEEIPSGYIYGYYDSSSGYSGAYYGTSGDYSNYNDNNNGGVNYGGGFPSIPVKLPNNKNLKICKQGDTTAECSIYALDYVSKYFDGDKMGINKDDFAESIGLNKLSAKIKFQIPQAKGADGLEVTKMIDTFFNNKPINGSISSIIDSLNTGKPILAILFQGYREGYNKEIEEQGHLVVITGYDPQTNMVTFSDSLSPEGETTMYYNRYFLRDQRSIDGFKDTEEVEKYKHDDDWWEGCNINFQKNK